MFEVRLPCDGIIATIWAGHPRLQSIEVPEDALRFGNLTCTVIPGQCKASNPE
jgi:hypothetical protein